MDDTNRLPDNNKDNNDDANNGNESMNDEFKEFQADDVDRVTRSGDTVKSKTGDENDDAPPQKPVDGKPPKAKESDDAEEAGNDSDVLKSDESNDESEKKDSDGDKEDGKPSLVEVDPETGEIRPKPYLPRRSKSATPTRAEIYAAKVTEYAKLRAHDGEFVFKLSSALVVSVMAALIVMLAGHSFERLHEVVVTRAFIAFVVAFLVMELFYTWLGSSGLPHYVKKHDELRNVWVSKPEDSEDLLNDIAGDDDNSEKQSEETSPDGEEQQGTEEGSSGRDGENGASDEGDASADEGQTEQNDDEGMSFESAPIEKEKGKAVNNALSEEQTHQGSSASEEDAPTFAPLGETAKHVGDA